MSDVMTFNGIPLMTYGLTCTLIAVLTRALFIPESSITIPKYDFADTFAQLSVPSFAPALPVAIPIPAIFSPSSELSKSVSDMLSPEIFQKSSDQKIESTPKINQPPAQEIKTPQAQEIKTPQAQEIKTPQAQEIKTPQAQEINYPNSSGQNTDEEELGLKGGKNKKKRKTRKYR
jgi:hypothetical protein